MTQKTSFHFIWHKSHNSIYFSILKYITCRCSHPNTRTYKHLQTWFAYIKSLDTYKKIFHKEGLTPTLHWENLFCIFIFPNKIIHFNRNLNNCHMLCLHFSYVYCECGFWVLSYENFLLHVLLLTLTFTYVVKLINKSDYQMSNMGFFHAHIYVTIFFFTFSHLP